MADSFSFPGAKQGQQDKGGQKGGFHLFKKKEEPKPPKELQAPDVSSSVNALDQRLKIIESRYYDLNRKTQLMDKNALEQRKKVTSEIKLINDDILELKRNINDIKKKMEKVISELKSCARKEDVQTLSKYIDLWEPLNFATREEVDKIIQEKLDSNKQD